MRSFAPIWLLTFLVACGGGKAAEHSAPAPVIEPVVEEPPPPPRYVIVHRNTPIRLAPAEDAPFLQYRTPERQEKIEARRAKADTERAEKAAEAETARKEKEKKRRARNRKRRRKYSRKKRARLAQADKERAAEQRIKRAERKLRDIRRRAEKNRLAGPDRPWIPFELVKEKGEWLQLSPVSRASERPHCYARNFGEVDRLAATFWVKKDEVATVTTKSISIAPDQGTEVVLRPGVALTEVESETGDRYVAYVDGFALELTIPQTAVGTTYEPARPFEAPMTDTVFTARALAEGKLRLGRGMPLPFNPYRDLFVTGTLVVGSRFYVTTQTPCGEYTVRARKEHIEPVGKRGVTRLSGATDVVKPPYARPGAMSHLVDGEPFAVVRAKFPLGVETQKTADHVCFRSKVWGRSNNAVSRALELCFAAEDLELGDDK